MAVVYETGLETNICGDEVYVEARKMMTTIDGMYMSQITFLQQSSSRRQCER
jgi:hypothetical protein